MAELGLDYAYARPTGTELVTAGVSGVGRYLGFDSRCITKPEYDDYLANGIVVWFVYEGAASGMLGGFGKGVSDANTAVASLNAIGAPADSLVYAAADWDVTTGQYAAADAYMQGFTSVLGSVARTGIYGGLAYLNHCYAAGLATRFWECASTSFAHGQTAQMQIHLHQTLIAPPIAATDHNYILDPSFASSGDVIPIDNKPKDDAMPLFNDTAHTIYWPNGYYDSYDTGIYNALKYWAVNGIEQAGTEGTVQREVWHANDFMAQREAQVVITAVQNVVAAIPAGGGAPANIDVAALAANIVKDLPTFKVVPAA